MRSGRERVCGGAVAFFVVVIMVLLSLFALAQGRIFSSTVQATSDVNLANAKNLGKLLSNSRQGGSRPEPDVPMIDAEWWDTRQHALPAPQPRGLIGGVSDSVRRMLPGSTSTPVDNVLPLQRRNRQPVLQWDDDDQQYDDRLIVS